MVSPGTWDDVGRPGVTWGAMEQPEANYDDIPNVMTTLIRLKKLWRTEIESLRRDKSFEMGPDQAFEINQPQANLASEALLNTRGAPGSLWVWVNC